MKYSNVILLKSNKFLVLIASILIFIACDDLFEFSPYEANVKIENANTTAKNLLLLKDIYVESDDFKFAIISVSHFFFTHLRDVIDDINKKGDISFVIFGGDMPHQGLLKEYEIFFNIAQNLDKPYLSVIGNHDYKLNGRVIYKEMFVDFNYSFEFCHNKFVFF